MTCGHCDNCSATCARDRCASACLGHKGSKPVVHSIKVVLDGAEGGSDFLGPAEEYAVHGSDCHNLCGDFGPYAVEQHLEEALRDMPRALDQVLPLPDEPSGGGPPNIGERQGVEALEDECRFNAGKLAKIQQLAKVYSHWRPVRGDGNCYYRTVVFGALEALIAAGDVNGLQKVFEAFEQVTYKMPREQWAHEEMLRRLRSWRTLNQLETWVARDAGTDQALVRACRRLVRLYLIRHADKLSPNGLTYGELVNALDTTYRDVEDFCLRVVDPMGRDAETLALDALPLQLGLGIRLWILDRRSEVDLVSLDTPSPEGRIDVHVLFKPGHYDLLYPRAEEQPIPEKRTLGADAATVLREM